MLPSQKYLGQEPKSFLSNLDAMAVRPCLETMYLAWIKPYNNSAECANNALFGNSDAFRLLVPFRESLLLLVLVVVLSVL